MENFKYLIVGGGMTADSAAKGIRDVDPEGSIVLFSQEKDPPYKRPLLSKGLWKGKPLDSIWRHTEEQQVTQYLGRKVISLDADRMVVQDDQGNEFHGERILLATGGVPRRLPYNGEAIIYFRTLEDYRQLSALAAVNQDFTVIGGGFIGAEIAAALAMNGKKITMLFPEDGIGARIYPHDLSQFLNDFYRKKGVEILAGEQAVAHSSSGNQHSIKTTSGRKLVSNGVIAGIGINLSLELARSAGLHLGNGIQVDEYLVTSHPNIFAAGDVAEFQNTALGKRIRLEHEDNAVSMGRLAGRNMADAAQPYNYLPYFYSDLFELGYEAVGELDSRLQTAVDWAEPYQKGIIYYFREDRVCGVLLWNVWDKVPAARDLIAQPGPFRVGDIYAKRSVGWKITYS
jgi:3-phenylpropionate/trans-cinnamate dioxygenase ferredoxin reductase subunit